MDLSENPIRTELHNHILPGVDDGVASLEESLAVLGRYAEWGYRRVIITPHIMAGYYPNEESDLRKRRDELQNAVDAAGITIQLRVAAEYFLDETLVERAQNRSLLTLGGNWLLVETDFLSRPFSLAHQVFELQVRGYRIVLAHPERYLYMHREPSIYQELRDKGVRFQLNLFSLIGYYGPEIRHFAEYLVERGWVDLIGSDLHGQRHLSVMEKALTSPMYRKVVELGLANDHLPWE